MKKEIALKNKGFHDLNPLIIGMEDCRSSHSYGPHIRSYYLLHYVTRGHGRFYIGGKTYHLEKNNLFIICPGTVTTYTADVSDPWSYIWIGFDGALAARLDTLSPVIRLQTSLFQEMLSCDSLDSCREEFLVSKLFLLFSTLFERKSSSGDYVQQVCDYIDSNYFDQLSVQNLARIVGIDRTYLSRLFSQRMGISIQRYLIQVRMNHACELLRQGYSVSEASAMAGYHDVFNFSKMFKRMYLISPTRYKKENTAVQ